MFIYISILMAVLVISMFSIVWERRWKARNPTAAEEQGATSPAAKLRQGIATIWATRPWQQPESALPHQFRAWSTQVLAKDDAVRDWLDALSDPAYVAFVEHMAEFADELGSNLADLVTGQMVCLPSVAQSATQIIVHYCRANQQAALVQDDFDGYRAYAAYLQSPTSVDSQRFVQQLYAALVEQRMAPAPTPDLLALTDQERLAQMQDAIRQAAEKPEGFRGVLGTVVAERRRTTADLTVAKIVQRAMAKVVKPAAEPSPAAPITGQEMRGTAEEQDDASVVVLA